MFFRISRSLPRICSARSAGIKPLPSLELSLLLHRTSGTSTSSRKVQSFRLGFRLIQQIRYLRETPADCTKQAGR